MVVLVWFFYYYVFIHLFILFGGEVCATMECVPRSNDNLGVMALSFHHVQF